MNIFWDWDRTLGKQPFWNKLTQEDEGFQQDVATLFASNAITLWMRGEISFDQVQGEFLSRYDMDFLKERVASDWLSSDAIDTTLLEEIKERYPAANQYIVTDNMDIFEYYVQANHAFFDQFETIYNSSRYGVLKSDNNGLFEKVLGDLAVDSFAGDILIDDSQENCATFTRLGGMAINTPPAR